MIRKGRSYLPGMWRNGKFLRLCAANCSMPNVVIIPSNARGINFSQCKSMYFDQFPNERYALQICNIRSTVRCCSTSTSEPIFFETIQNTYSMNILANCERYANTITLPMERNDNVSVIESETLLGANWKNAKLIEILDAFKSLSYHVSNNPTKEFDERYHSIFNAIIENITLFPDKELCEILRYLQLWRTGKSNIVDFCTALDQECIRRLNTWSTDQILFVLDLWYKLSYVKKSFMWRGLTQIGKKPNRMSPSNLNCLNDLTVDEIGIVLIGFFKTKTSIQNPDLLARLIQIVMNNINDIHEITLGCYLKMIRYSLHFPETLTFYVLLKQLEKQVPRLSIQCLTQVVHSAASAQIFEENLVNAVADRFLKEAQLCRLKDLERLSFTLYTFNFDKSHPAYNVIIQELSRPERLKEIKMYPKSLAYTLMHMACAGLYPEYLLEMVMTASFLNNMYGKSMMKAGRDILFLTYSIQIEFPEYKGPTIDQKTLNYLVKTHGHLRPLTEKKKVSPLDKLLNEVSHTCKEVLKCTEAVYTNTVLPHFLNSDVVVCLDENNCPVPINSVFAEMPFGSVKRPPEMPMKNLKWFVFIMGSRTNFMSNCYKYNGILTARKRQLERIGYKPTLIEHVWWFKMNSEKRQNFISSLLFK